MKGKKTETEKEKDENVEQSEKKHKKRLLIYEEEDEEVGEEEQENTSIASQGSEKKELPSDLAAWVRILAYLRVFYYLYGLEVGLP